MILQSIWWMDLKIGKHLDIQIRYKILQLKFSKHSPFKNFQLAFKGGYFLAVFMEKKRKAGPIKKHKVLSQVYLVRNQSS